VIDAFRTEAKQWILPREGYTLHGRTWGDGPPLYLLGGFLGTQVAYAPLIWLLRRSFRCVVWDYPGSQEPVRGRRPFSLADMADDVRAVADHHSDARFSLFATSFGSLVALQTLLSDPSRIERAVLQGGFAHRKLTLWEKTAVRAGRWIPAHLARFRIVRSIQRFNHLSWFPPFDRNRWDFYLEDTGRLSLRSFSDRVALAASSDFRGRLSEISRPILLIGSEGEGTIAARSHVELQKGLQNVDSKRLGNCGLLPHLTHPHRLAKLVSGFLEGEPESAPPACGPEAGGPDACDPNACEPVQNMEQQSPATSVGCHNSAGTIGD
jgi:pimeloyl-ACP methyl ester carboxylesterase